MEQNKIDTFIASNGDKFPSEKFGIMHSRMEQLDDNKYIMLQSADYKNPVTLFIISFFLGSFGVDRFMLGHTGLGVGKLLTCGGLGVWALIDWFLIMKATKEKNFLTFTEIAAG
jgi:TM2 domain-containing membrane protein YozV